ncbi:MAG: DUF1850 domain-containing protein [Burkholderiales bacterium]
MSALAALCMVAGSLHASLPINEFTLRWTHSIERIEWSEDYELAGRWLHLSRAHVRGSGAGMDPPAGAWLQNGVWSYRLADPWRRELVLARSPYVADYELCFAGHCQALSHWIPVSAGPTTLLPC